MDPLLLLSFLGAAILLTLMPGPDILFVTAQSISQNKKAGIFTALGLCTGLIVHITAATLGISAIVYQSALAFTVVKFAGALYLFYLAWKSFRDKGQPFTIKQQECIDYFSLYKRGIIMSSLNPKVSLFFLALLPQFVDYSWGHISLQMFILGFIFLIQALLIFIVVSFFAEKIGQLLSGNSFIARKMNLIQGTLFGIIGLQIAFSEK
jgi:threonine/homoserine/homoserine lactone efflux protein